MEIDEKAHRFWPDAQTDNIRRFAAARESVKQSYRDLWKTLIGIHGVILGISIALMAYKGANPNVFLVCTWISQVISIFLGLVIFKVDIDIESATESRDFLFRYDMNEISMKEEQGEFIGDEVRRQGLIVAALMKCDPDQSSRSDKATEWARTYECELPTFNWLKERKMSQIAKCAKVTHRPMVSLFYIISWLSFGLLLLSILWK